MASTPTIVKEPFPIFKLAGRYLLYDVDVITYIRRAYNICGVLIGGLPQAPQQNVFLGIPLELMPEEARLLAEKGVMYIVDDVKAHKQGFLGGGLSVEERKAYHTALRKQGVSAASQASRKSDERKKAAWRQKMGTNNCNDVPEDVLKASSTRSRSAANGERADDEKSERNCKVDEDEMLFGVSMNSHPSKTDTNKSRVNSNVSTAYIDAWAITPTTSYPPLQSSPSEQDAAELPEAPHSYPLFKHVHDKGYFLTPGLRFGCQYTAYPGDPLRFHSHFLCNGMEWEQEFDLLDLVGGGRLGTGVKKGFLIGGEKPKKESDEGGADAEDRGGGKVRTFCIEWGGM